MKVLHLIDSGGLYGAEKMLLALLNQQVGTHIQPILLSCGDLGQETKAIEQAAIEHGLEVISWRMKSGLNLAGMRQIIAWAKAQKIDVFHTHGFKFNVLFGLIPKPFRRQFKWVVTVHGFIPAKPFSKGAVYQWLDKKVSQLSDRLCLVSPAMLAIAEFKHHKRTSVILNGIDSETQAIKHKAKLATAPLKLLCIGRLSPEKGMNDLIEAIAILQQRGITNLGLTIMGDGPLKPALIQQISALKLEQKVTLAGFVDQPTKYLLEYDVLVMPSLTEGIPITLLESMREKLPIIASAVGGIPFILGQDYPFLTIPADVNNLADNIATFSHTGHGEIKSLVDKNQKRFVDSFTAEQMHDNYLAVYENLS